MLEGIYRTRLKQQPPAEWEQLDRAQRTAKLQEAVIKSWAESTVLLRQLGQARASSIKDYLVDKGQLQDDRVYFIDATLGQAEADGRVISPCTWTPSRAGGSTGARPVFQRTKKSPG